MALPDVTDQLFAVCASPHVDDPDDTCHVAKKLISAGADVNAKRRHVEGVVFLSRTPPGGDLTPFFVACYRGNLALAKLLADSGASDDRALVAAAEKCWLVADDWQRVAIALPPGKKPQLVGFLVGRGFKVNVKVSCKKLHCCAPSTKSLIFFKMTAIGISNAPSIGHIHKLFNISGGHSPLIR
jgi:hypothetical protein